MSNIAIILVGYNRLASMKRLYTSLLNAEYAKDKVDLIISLDRSERDDVFDWANQVEWENGKKIVYRCPQRMGLRNHILHCGEYLKIYDAVIVLEDDICVSPGFYLYAKAAVEHYENNMQIAGISLYNHEINVNSNLRFIPEISYYDNYFIQFAQSWGQVWMRKQWNSFMQWYEQHKEEKWDNCNWIPKFVASWPETSWLKYHIIYCIANHKFFSYPYISQTTCFSEAGEHCGEKISLYQVRMSRDVKTEYKFMELNEDSICYDAFFERMGLGRYLGIEEDTLCTNFYNTKNVSNAKYQLSIEFLPYKVEKSYDLDYYPYELNVMNNNWGNQLFLYNMQIKEERKETDKNKLRRSYLHKISWEKRTIKDILWEIVFK